MTTPGNSKRNAILAGLLGLAVVGAVGFWFQAPGGVQGKAVDRRSVALRVLGEYLATNAPGARVAVFTNPFADLPGQPAETRTFQTAAIEGLRAGLGSKAVWAGAFSPALSEAARQDPSSVPMPPNATTPLSFLTQVGAWDRLWIESGKPSVIVSLIGLPVDLLQLDLWRQPQPRLALLLPDFRILGDPATVRTAFHSGKLAAAVVARPGAPSENTALERDHRLEFERRYLLVTPGNVDRLVQEFPGLF